MGTRASRRSRAHSLVQLADEVSAVINRVRRAFGSIPMAPVAARPEIAQAEEAVNRAASHLRGGQTDWSGWRQALYEYEALWMALLDEVRQTQDKRYAA
ncbi:MAG: hypothetical protein GKR89_23075 [Candidatus Latescibacteria bacterium]|nr:hypothetical protein [Candidatus Latescibacterota bacterium]